MATNKKLKAFARIDGSGRVVPGTLLLREKKPKVGKWQEVDANECCNTIDACFTAMFSYAPDGGDNIAIFIANVPIAGAPNTTGIITWGDGQSTTISIAGSGSYTFTHTYSEPGLYAINVCINNPEYVDTISINPDSDGGNPIISLSGLNTLRYIPYLNFGFNSLTSLTVNNLPYLIGLNASNNQLTSIDLTGCTALTTLSLQYNNLTSIDLSGLSYLTNIEIGNNSLTQTVVDNILVTLASGSVDNGYVNLAGGTNSAPSATGLAAKTTLEGRSWTVNVTP